ncbi:hypothetical protein, partial [Eggerthella lenta]|uniref:hypothetical protein n=1 Tax=Eggerthella lenta TaxID=84112 RepID=UPI001C69C4CF
LRGFFNAVEGAGDLLPKTGPDATAAAAINFIRSLTKSLGLLDPDFCRTNRLFALCELGKRPCFQ